MYTPRVIYVLDQIKPKMIKPPKQKSTPKSATYLAHTLLQDQRRLAMHFILPDLAYVRIADPGCWKGQPDQDQALRADDGKQPPTARRQRRQQRKRLRRHAPLLDGHPGRVLPRGRAPGTLVLHQDVPGGHFGGHLARVKSRRRHAQEVLSREHFTKKGRSVTHIHTSSKAVCVHFQGRNTSREKRTRAGATAAATALNAIGRQTLPTAVPLNYCKRCSRSRSRLFLLATLAPSPPPSPPPPTRPPTQHPRLSTKTEPRKQRRTRKRSTKSEGALRLLGRKQVLKTSIRRSLVPPFVQQQSIVIVIVMMHNVFRGRWRRACPGGYTAPSTVQGPAEGDTFCGALDWSGGDMPIRAEARRRCHGAPLCIIIIIIIDCC